MAKSKQEAAPAEDTSSYGAMVGLALALGVLALVSLYVLVIAPRRQQAAADGGQPAQRVTIEDDGAGDEGGDGEGEP